MEAYDASSHKTAKLKFKLSAAQFIIRRVKPAEGWPDDGVAVGRVRQAALQKQKKQLLIIIIRNWFNKNLSIGR